VDNLNDILCFTEVKYIGCINYRASKRFVELEKIAEIFREAKSKRPDLRTVLVMVNPTGDEIRNAMKVTRADILQLSGDEEEEFVNEFDLYTVWKTIHVADIKDINKILDYTTVENFVLDTKVQGSYGGTGVSFDFGLFNRAKDHTRHLILSGGLNRENIYDAIKIANPRIIDICTGVESSPGIKSKDKIDVILTLINTALYV